MLEQATDLKILKEEGTTLEFEYQGKIRSVDFDDYYASDNHGNFYSTGYISGKDQYGNEWSMDAEAEMGSVIDWDPDTIIQI